MNVIEAWPSPNVMAAGSISEALSLSLSITVSRSSLQMCLASLEFTSAMSGGRVRVRDTTFQLLHKLCGAWSTAPVIFHLRSFLLIRTYLRNCIRLRLLLGILIEEEKQERFSSKFRLILRNNCRIFWSILNVVVRFLRLSLVLSIGRRAYASC